MLIISREEAKKQGLYRYFTGKPCKKGHISQKYVSNMGCVQCRTVMTTDLSYRKKEKSEYNDLGIKYKKQMWWRAKKRAEKKNLDFNIELEDIIIPEFCPVFNFKFEVSNGKGPSDASPSLDRIDASKGYIKGNIQVISFKANRIKTDCDYEDLEIVARFLKSSKQ